MECVGKGNLGDKKKDFDSESRTVINNWDKMLVETLKNKYNDFYKGHE